MTFRNNGLAPAALLAATLSYGMVAQATVIFQSDFEAPSYSTGALAGQNGWQVFGASSAVTVDSTAPIDGLQSAKINGALALSPRRSRFR